MTVVEAQTKRDEMEHAILSLITKYERETALTVQKIELQHAKAMGSTQLFTVSVSIPVYIS